MKTYRVRWEIDIDAKNPVEAAAEAWDILRDPASLAPIFDVKQEGFENFVPVDLEEFDVEEL